MSFRLGFDAKIYVIDPGSYTAAGTPVVWDTTAGENGPDGTPTLITNAQNVTLNLERAEADVTVRGGNGWRQTVGTLRDASVDFQLLWDDDAVTAKAASGTYEYMTWIRKAFLGTGEAGMGDKLEFVILDGPITPSDTVKYEGLHAVFVVTSMTRSEGLEEALTLDVSIKPTVDAAVSPAWVQTNDATS